MPVNPSRRRLVFGTGAARTLPLRPPWAGEASIAEHCTGCGDCADACPEGIIRLDGQQHPVVAFGHGKCTFCGDCAEACAVPVFSIDDDRRAFGHHMAIEAGCLALRSVFCQSCGDACPEAAIRFRLVLGGPPRPELDAESCTGCGACVGICPVDAISVVQRAQVPADG